VPISTEQVVTIKRSYHSIGWLTTANIMKTRAADIGSGEQRPEEPAYGEMRAYVLSAVTGSAAFLEASINELFADAHEYLAGSVPEALRGLKRETQIRMAALWPYAKKYGVMEKHRIALSLAEADPLDPGAEPVQSAADLLLVRNHYLHYQPESVRGGTAQGGDKKLTSRMQGKLTLPEWDSGGEDLFPTRAICPDLARWALESAVRFTDAFCGRLGIAPGYDHVRPAWLA
jgi:hypothetical protein